MRHMRVHLWQVAGDGLPGGAVVAGAINIGLEVAVEVAIDGDDGLAGIVRRKIDTLDAAKRRQVGDVRSYVRPGCAAISRKLHQPVVGANPDDILVLLRRRDAEDCVEGLSARVVLHHRSAGGLLLALVIQRQIRTDRLPGAATVVALASSTFPPAYRTAGLNGETAKPAFQ